MACVVYSFDSPKLIFKVGQWTLHWDRVHSKQGHLGAGEEKHVLWSFAMFFFFYPSVHECHFVLRGGGVTAMQKLSSWILIRLGCVPSCQLSIVMQYQTCHCSSNMTWCNKFLIHSHVMLLFMLLVWRSGLSRQFSHFPIKTAMSANKQITVTVIAMTSIICWKIEFWMPAFFLIIHSRTQTCFIW